MAELTVAKLAETVGTPVEKLLEQMKSAGIEATSASSAVTEQQKQDLLAYLRKSHGEDVGGPQRITLQRKSLSTLKVATTSGTTKQVQVEVRKKRTFVKRTPEELAALEAGTAKPEVEEEPKHVELEERRRHEEESRRQAELEARKRAEEEAARRAEEDLKRRTAEEAAKRPTDAAARPSAPAGAKPAAAKPGVAAKPVTAKRDDDDKRGHKSAGHTHKDGVKKRTDGTTVNEHVLKRSRVQDLIGEAGDDVGGGRGGGRRKGRRTPQSLQQNFSKPTAPVVREVAIPETITVGELAQKMAVKVADLIKSMMKMGMMATINQVLDQETAVLLVEELGHTAKPMSENALEAELLAQSKGGALEQTSRAPVVTIMGHVDHGKTSLLDYIRRTKVAAGEAGGITQHIGAYHVETPRGVITFLDTPGHAAFTAMRARGAKATDIVVLVVAADDSVMPQTIEAIQHARAANVPIVVAVTKVDKPSADREKVRSDLSQHNVLSEDWGGDVQFAYVSAKSGEGVDTLLEKILLQAEVLELKAPIEGPAYGVVIEARLDKGRGTVATVLVQGGTLRKGDILLAGTQFGRVRQLNDEAGRPVNEAGPSIPVEVLGLDGVPMAGDEATVVADERKAREVALFRQGKIRDVKLSKQKTKLEDLFANLQDGASSVLNVIVKADVNGSVEALSESLTKLSTSEVQVKVIAQGVGGITESDANLAAASNAILFGFNVRADASAKKVLEANGVDIRYHSIIYDVIDEVKSAMSGMLSPEKKQNIVGMAQVREVFKHPKFGSIAGCMVLEGHVKRSNPIRVLRDNVVIFEGELDSLRRFKDDVQEVRAGMECGIGVKNYNDVRAGDQIEVFEIVEVARTI
ncbi:translation initiation factor IF-2 [Permianibacter sp. IMCC34836]|uniref:translation initiation factor IF-2 n=1 Tax=Permianibacter fluminis TaxID=2738515 RepID=UPI00155240C0|nr:translation initiation factor IF-2 [Permianibacter fluminis]NQD36527.1 translation initiation factor IF-2 [Permianibacter fluminis]